MSEVAAIVLSDELETGRGYYLGLSFSGHELSLVRSLVQSHWIENIKIHAPTHWEKFAKLNITKYHELSDLIDHASVWPKINRILPQSAVDFIRSTSLIKRLEHIYGCFEISDEENIGREEIYWRLVRPNQPSDVGPLHADAWFWELGHGLTPSGAKRVKVWIAIYCEPGLNGLLVVPDSQKKEWKYHGEYRDSFSKPQIDEDVATPLVRLACTKPGDAIVFNDKLLHGGALNQGRYTRVSIEFTLFIRNN
ncbi:MAG: hypothetical protein A3I77_03720 [Gammaproteobacteria bacterium RIFCSPLOWO2_02_FULL_42_14]|nr:MAG: hypothetical protein A3B71_05025 [Gammaproteobacteria bacterium RIFCSPHIGHO2_02_FULL_42_43]OGT28916.1 MAG: hypothetical protein A2624_02350 [Gammaproteobacteria bacterium RIFCSPHIGHO2_01_FULL_42_8]OGT51366.1 MAG: hypothetical protein A3E54_04790 [Gammaproteobacteria bacterium RIFCSPHIGHO2_12_FULL_41_25]OGT62068.1 MAG: hypothetical protein A3I77_03720 [Gammaproteobacteria bacterium RIFCSPLOWO2_02_FULL_42_14]OGT85740.1 MAG: hypothetical protein A3G86_03415 [Gammaproteobacteria bacterium R